MKRIHLCLLFMLLTSCGLLFWGCTSLKDTEINESASHGIEMLPGNTQGETSGETSGNTSVETSGDTQVKRSLNKKDPQVILEVDSSCIAGRTLDTVSVGYKDIKSVKILSADAEYNDWDLTFPTVLVKLDIRVVVSDDPEEPMPLAYTLFEAGLPMMEYEEGVINLGTGYNAGDEFTYTMELKNLEPGRYYLLRFVDGSRSKVAATEEVRSALRNEGAVMTRRPYFPDEIKWEGLYDDSFVVKDVAFLSFNYGSLYNAISFGLANEEGNLIGVPATADLRFVSNEGETLYESTVSLTAENYRLLTDEYEAEGLDETYMQVVGKILIPVEASEELYKTLEGTLYVSFYGEGDFTATLSSCTYSYINPPEEFLCEKLPNPPAREGVIY